MKMMNITYGEPKPEQLNFLNDNKQERHCTNRGMYSAFLYEKRVTMLLSVWLIHQLLAFIINDNGYHYHCQWFSKNIYKTLYILNRDKKNSINAVLFR